MKIALKKHIVYAVGTRKEILLFTASGQKSFRGVPEAPQFATLEK